MNKIRNTYDSENQKSAFDFSRNIIQVTEEPKKVKLKFTCRLFESLPQGDVWPMLKWLTVKQQILNHDTYLIQVFMSVLSNYQAQCNFLT